MVDVLLREEGEAERREERGGLNAVRKRRREPVVVRRGVKDWKRFVRVGEEGMVAGLMVGVCCWWAVGWLLEGNYNFGWVFLKFALVWLRLQLSESSSSEGKSCEVDPAGSTK